MTFALFDRLFWTTARVYFGAVAALIGLGA